MNTTLYTIRTLTNLHVGSGDINFDIIDNQVQRDENGFPVIRSSSLKGALREHTRHSASIGNGQVKYIFGPENDDDDASQRTGAYTFFEASMLTRPVRSNVKPYFNATSPAIIRQFVDTMEDLNIAMDSAIVEGLEALAGMVVPEGTVVVFESLEDAKIEGIVPQTQSANDTIRKALEFLGGDIALFAHTDLANLALPILARNQLDNGESKNLWYEEVVPKRSQFYFVLGKPENIDPEDADRIAKADAAFDSALGEIVQIGAGASIGYGYVRITKGA
jgi:CRISPR-associated protein Cmr4